MVSMARGKRKARAGGRRVVARWLMAAALPLTAVFWNASPADAGVNLYFQLYEGGSSFSNWDFQDINLTQTDWPVDMMFYGNGVSKRWIEAYAKANLGFPYSGSKKFAMTDGGLAVDDGVKEYPGGCVHWGDSLHFRVYDEGDFTSYPVPLYSVAFGNFVVATSHNDYSEGCSGYEYSLHTEGDETTIANRWQNAGFSVAHDIVWMDNQYNNNDGNAAAIYIP